MFKMCPKNVLEHAKLKLIKTCRPTLLNILSDVMVLVLRIFKLHKKNTILRMS